MAVGVVSVAASPQSSHRTSGLIQFATGCLYIEIIFGSSARWGRACSVSHHTGLVCAARAALDVCFAGIL